MPFDNSALLPLASSSGFTIWLYRTPDTRAVALAAGYFTPAAARLVTGDVMFLQAADALTLTTIRANTVIAAGLVVDTAATPFRATRSAAQKFSVRQVAGAVAMTLVLAPLMGGIVAGGTVQAQAAVAGPIGEVAFSIRDSLGTTVRGPQQVSVSAGAASATLAAPDPGTGYRLRVEAVGFPDVADTSSPFVVSRGFGLLKQDGNALLLENLAKLLLA